MVYQGRFVEASWIPAFAGMTEGAAIELEESSRGGLRQGGAGGVIVLAALLFALAAALLFALAAALLFALAAALPIALAALSPSFPCIFPVIPANAGIQEVSKRADVFVVFGFLPAVRTMRDAL